MIDEYIQGIKDFELMNKRNERKLKMKTNRCSTCGRKLKNRTEQIINNINKAFKNDAGNSEKQIALALATFPLYKEHLVNVHESSMGGKIYRSPVFFTAKEVKDMADTSDIRVLQMGRYAYIIEDEFVIADELETELIEQFEMYGV